MSTMPESETTPRQATEVDHRLNEGWALHQNGEFAAAEDIYRSELAKEPDYHRSHSILGVLLMQLKRTDEGIDHLSRAAALAPQNLEHRANLAKAFHDTLNFEAAIEEYRALLNIDPRKWKMRAALGQALHQIGNRGAAAREFDIVIENNDGNAREIENFAKTLVKLDRKDQALALVNGAVVRHPTAKGLAAMARRLQREEVPGWPFAMINDDARNQALEAAIERAVRPGITVLEIGTGSGLLAMMAVRAGASHVYTCEAVPIIAEKAKEIVAANGFADTVTVISKKSTELKIGTDLPARADLLISEIVGVFLMDENIIPTFRDAKERLLTPDAQVIPARGRIIAALLALPDITRGPSVDTVAGFDLSPFNEFSPRKHKNMDIGLFEHDLLSTPGTIHTYDFREPWEQKLKLSGKAAATKKGRCDAVAFWFELDIDDYESISSAPDSTTHWKQSVYALDAPLDVVPGQVVQIEMVIAGKSVGIRVPTKN